MPTKDLPGAGTYLLLVKAASLGWAPLYFPGISSHERQRQENLEFKTSFSFTRSRVSNKTNKITIALTALWHFFFGYIEYSKKSVDYQNNSA